MTFEPPDATELPSVDVMEFVLHLGVALVAAGNPINSVDESIQLTADVYGVPRARLFIVPTGFWILSTTGEGLRMDFAAGWNDDLQFDQIAAISELEKVANKADIDPVEGLAKLDEIRDMPPRFSLPILLFGQILQTVGVALVLQPTYATVAFAVAFGLFSGILMKFARHRPSLQMLMPVIMSVVVASAVFLMTRYVITLNPLRILIPPLVTLLPGALLTTGMIELTAGSTVSGATRLVSGVVRLLLLSFGIVAAADLTGISSAAVLMDNPADVFGLWAPWIGVTLFGLGNHLAFSGPKRSWPKLLLVLYVAWGGQLLGNVILGGFMSAFVGALLMTPVAFFVERHLNGPPVLVTFLPAFWILVPGAIGLIGFTELASTGNSQAGIGDFFTTVFTIVSVALGMLVGVQANRAIRHVEKVTPFLNSPT